MIIKQTSEPLMYEAMMTSDELMYLYVTLGPTTNEIDEENVKFGLTDDKIDQQAYDCLMNFIEAGLNHYIFEKIAEVAESLKGKDYA